MAAILTFCVLLTVLMSDVMSTTFYVENECQRSGHVGIEVTASGKDSAGILKASDSGMFIPGMNCSISIKPPRRYGIVVSIRLLDLKPEGKCTNHLEIFTDEINSVVLCGFKSDDSEKESYHSNGEMVMWFHTANDSTSNETSSQFQLTFTSVKKGNGRCRNDRQKCLNGFCIWKGLLCDGHNNCGDLSDEAEHGISDCYKQKANIVWAAVIAAIAVSLVCCFIVVQCMPGRTQKESQTIKNLRVPFKEYGSTRSISNQTRVDINLPSTSRWDGSSRPMVI